MIIVPMPIILPTGRSSGNPADLIPDEFNYLTHNIFRYSISLPVLALLLSFDLLVSLMVSDAFSSAWHYGDAIYAILGCIMILPVLLLNLLIGGLSLAFLCVPYQRRKARFYAFLSPWAITLRWALAVPMFAAAIWLGNWSTGYALWGFEGLYAFEEDWFDLIEYSFALSAAVLAAGVALNLTLGGLRLLHPRKRA
jgi:hypothetical protein